MIMMMSTVLISFFDDDAFMSNAFSFILFLLKMMKKITMVHVDGNDDVDTDDIDGTFDS